MGEYVLLCLLLTCKFILKTQDSPGKIKDIIHNVASEQLLEEKLYSVFTETGNTLKQALYLFFFNTLQTEAAVKFPLLE